MTQFDILVKSSIPPCPILARTAPEFTECNSRSASMRASFVFFSFYTTNWTLGWLHMLQNGFSLNQKKENREKRKKTLSEIQHCGSAEQLRLQASVQVGANENQKCWTSWFSTETQTDTEPVPLSATHTQLPVSGTVCLFSVTPPYFMM